ncbi:hypothetical protein [Winogradskyella sp.]|uniref:hypothetical protein n=1 Tax=Winogradskyella sp. TaxID=1883156 RepID=UPI0025E31FB7|nr:hypothetical protein [Winogradskyella sp.]
MKIKLNYIFTILCFLVFSFNSYAQNHNIKGYKIEGEDVIFIFDANDYPNILNNGDTIDNVFVSGEFNNWAKDQWKMDKVNDSIYQLRKQLSIFTSDFDWEFKFIVNSEHWAEPSINFENIADAKDYRGHPLMTYNLKLYSAFATIYGNVSFKLKGFTNAKNVILSGTFNRWDENGFIMKPTENGWQVTLQLRPDIYEYKFIVDGEWIEDPQNPSMTKNNHHGFNSVIDVQKTVEFRLCDFPDAETVILSGEFNDWSEENYKMTKVDDCWIYNEKLSGGKYHYKFIVDGEWITDPINTVKEYDDKGHINSVCMVK